MCSLAMNIGGRNELLRHVNYYKITENYKFYIRVRKFLNFLILQDNIETQNGFFGD